MEAGTGKSVWACGLRPGDPNLQNQSAWPLGCLNLAGIILNYVKNQIGEAELQEDVYKEVYSKKPIRRFGNRNRTGSAGSASSMRDAIVTGSNPDVSWPPITGAKRGADCQLLNESVGSRMRGEESTDDVQWLLYLNFSP